MPFRARSDSATGSTVVDHATPPHADTNMPAWRAKAPILETRVPFKSCPEPDTPHLSQVNPEELDRLLLGYPEPDRSFLVHGFKQGFKLQHEGPRVSCMAKNHGSALKNPNVVSELLSREIELGRIAGPFNQPPAGQFIISPLGLVPKKEMGAYRLIHDLSFPHGSSVNDGIDRLHATVQYETLDKVIQLVKQCGRGALVSKCDIEEAFRQIPVHPDDYNLLGFTWMGKFYHDKRLAMGCASSCQIFERFSCALQWIVINLCPYAKVSHILDDFIFIGNSASQMCQSQLECFQNICYQIGLPIKHSKTVHPCTDIHVHGLRINTVTMITSLPMDKIEKVINLLGDFCRKKKITLVTLQSICGLLNFACKAIVPGRPFLRRIINLTIGLSKSFHHVRINSEARADALAWLQFLEQFNGVSMFLNDPWLRSETLQLGTDASGMGYAAVFGSKWFTGIWPVDWNFRDITAKELFPIVLAIKIWAPLLKNHKILFLCDNMAVVNIINKQSCKDTFIMILVRELVVTSLHNNVLFRAQHIVGRKNVLCDQLSRAMFQEARRTAPWLNQQPTRIPTPWLPT